MHLLIPDNGIINPLKVNKFARLSPGTHTTALNSPIAGISHQPLAQCRAMLIHGPSYLPLSIEQCATQ